MLPCKLFVSLNQQMMFLYIWEITFVFYCTKAKTAFFMLLFLSPFMTTK